MNATAPVVVSSVMAEDYPRTLLELELPLQRRSALPRLSVHFEVARRLCVVPPGEAEERPSGAIFGVVKTAVGKPR